MNTPEGMKKTEDEYTYKEILTLIQSIYVFLQAAGCWFKEYIKTIPPKAGFKKCTTNPCLLYRVNELWIDIVIVYVYDTLAIKDKQVLMDTIEFIKKNIKLDQWVN